jgi:ketosteroid isomerase-like protein
MNAVVVGEDDPEIVALESRLRAAQLDADVNALDQLIADELLFTGPDGSVSSKAQDLAAHASGVVKFTAHEPQELRIRRVGSDVAVTALRARLTVEVDGVVVEGDYRYTRVWARETGDDWRVVGGHVSEVKP